MRSAHHRSDYRGGPHTGWLQRKARHIARVIRCVFALDRLILEVERLAILGVKVNPVVLLEARQARDIGWDYATDDTGEVWA
jgi:hypothetical protein